MECAEPCPLAAALAAGLRTSRMVLTARWLERIVQRVSVEPNRVFPTDALLDHMPLLVDGIADVVEDRGLTIAARTDVIDRARELGALRYAQGFSEHELQKEYEILGSVLFAFFTRLARESETPASPADVVTCSHRLFQAIAVVQQATTMEYVRRLTVELTEREERLQAFHRALTHEIRNRIGATLGAGQLLSMPELAEADRGQLSGVVVRNANGMRLVLENLLELAQVRVAPRQQRHVRLPAAAAESVRQLRDAAERAGVRVSLVPTLPEVEVNAAAVELCLTNYLANAIKYADPAAASRWIAVRAHIERGGDGAPARVVVEVADNGRGVPVAARERLFTRFFRAHETSAPAIEGTGLGLSIVRETVESLGGRAWAEFPDDGGSVFAFAMPCRRAVDAAVADTGPDDTSTGSAGRRDRTDPATLAR
jgi:signal transduction histidine kinase